MSIKQAIKILKRDGHTVHNSVAQPGKKWIVHYKGTWGAPCAMYRDGLIAAARELQAVTP